MTRQRRSLPPSRGRAAPLLRRWLGEPLLHFLLAGLLLFAAYGVLNPRAESALASRRIELTEGDLRQMSLAWLAQGRPAPTPEQLQSLVESRVREEILYREALARGLDRRDSVVARRLLRNMRFLRDEESAPEPSRADEAERLLREARALGMERTDLVVRRRLVQRMRLAIEAAAREPEPGEGELAAYLAAHAQRYAAPELVRASHVFFSRERGEAAALRDARALLAELARSGAGAVAAAGRGDAFLAPRDLPLQSERELAKLFGPEFARRLVALPLAAWSGPLASAHGFHLVWVHERIPGRIPPLDAVRDEVRYALLAERGERALHRAVAELRGRYRIEVERGRD